MKKRIIFEQDETVENREYNTPFTENFLRGASSFGEGMTEGIMMAMKLFAIAVVFIIIIFFLF